MRRVMKVTKYLLFGMLIAGLTACQTALRPIESFSIEELVTEAEVDISDYSDIITIRSMPIYQQSSQASISRLLPIIDSEQFFLRSFVSKSTEVVSHQVYVHISYRGDWRFYKSANKLGGNALDFLEIDRSVISCANTTLSGCLLSESFGIGLSSGEFREASTFGLRFRSNTNFSDRFNDFYIPPNVFKSQLQVIEGLRRN